jgi:hypothetical protein
MMGRLDAPILPGQTLGEIELGVPVRSYSEELLRADLRGKLEYRMRGLFEVNYLLENGAIEVGVDVRNGKIARVTARRGYTGLLKGGIRIGITAGEAMGINQELYYDEASELILSRVCPGLSLEVTEIDPLPQLVPRLKISAISVYHPILDTQAGQTGEW